MEFEGIRRFGVQGLGFRGLELRVYRGFEGDRGSWVEGLGFRDFGGDQALSGGCRGLGLGFGGVCRDWFWGRVFVGF